MCQVLGVSTSGYYTYVQRLDREETERERWNRKLEERIRFHFYDNYGIYGSPRIYQKLLREDFPVSPKKVANCMRKMNLYATPPKDYRITTDSEHSKPVYQNVLNREFRPAGPNMAWATDITYVHTGEGFLYLNPVIDLFSRRVISFKIADHMKHTLPLRALQEAIAKREPGEGLTHHSDRGSQYCSNDYIEVLKKANANVSMSRKGNPYDNACVESFFASLKKEYLYRNVFPTKGEAIQAIHFYIDFYNNKRTHSSLDYATPNEYELAHNKAYLKNAKQGVF